MTRRLTDVAEKVGVSEATVSRVLNGRPGVSAATRTAVLTALDVLGYERPTKLRGKRARLVGLVLPELQNPIFPALAEVVGGALAQLRFTPVLCASGPNGLSEVDYVNMLLDQHASGVIFAGGNFAEADSSHEHYRLLRERALPVVLVNAASEDLVFPQVSTDDAVAVEQAFSHLQALGHEEIGMVLGPEDHMPSRHRIEAYRAATSRLGLWSALSAPIAWNGSRFPLNQVMLLGPGWSSGGSPASSALVTCLRWALCGLCAGSAYGCPKTCRSSAMTTRPS